MGKIKPQPTFLVRHGNRIKEYTLGRIVRKLKTGDLLPDNLVHNRDGMWRPLNETPGFRRISTAVILDKLPLAPADIKNPEPVKVYIANSEEGHLEGVAENHSTEKHKSNFLTKDIPASLQQSSERADVSNFDHFRKLSVITTPPTLPPASGSSEGFRSVKASPNPYANRQYFRVRRASTVEVNQKQSNDLIDILLSPKGKIIAAGLIGLAGLYYSGQFFLGIQKTGKPPVSGQQLSLLVDTDQERSLLYQGHGRGVTERDKKFMESFRKLFMENIKQK